MTINVDPVNDPPEGTDKTVTISTNTNYTFSAEDFGFSDLNDDPANAMMAVKIITLPVAGVLTLKGSAVTEELLVSASDIEAKELVYTPTSGTSGTDPPMFEFQLQDDGGTDNGGMDLDDTTKNTFTINVVDITAPSAPTDFGIIQGY
jgi:hypothetical protein